MKILVITDRYPPFGIGGYELRCQEVVDSLRTRGHTVIVATTKFGVVKSDQSDEIFRIFDWIDSNNLSKNKLLYFWTQFKRLIMFRTNASRLGVLLDSIKPDIVYCFQLWNIGLISIQEISKRSIPKAIHISDYWFNDYFLKTNQNCSIFRKYARLLLYGIKNFEDLKIDKIIVVSSAMKKKLLDSGFVQREVETIPRGVKIDFIPLIVKSIAQDQINEHVKSDLLSLVYIGRLCEEKGVHIAIEAIYHLLKLKPLIKIKFEIIGTGDKNYIDMIIKQIKDLNLIEYINLLGYIEHASVIKRLSMYQILLFPSLWDEPFSGTILEAMSNGVTVISTNTGGSPEAIEDGINGLLVPPGDSRKMAEAISLIIDNVDLRNKMNINAFNLVKEKYDFFKTIDKIEDHLLKTINSKTKIC